MMVDVQVVVWKEWREHLVSLGSRRDAGIRVLLVGICSIVLPLSLDRVWIATPLSLLFWLCVSFLLGAGMAVHSFTSERTGHTLAALLATRLPERALLFGKLGAATLYSWGTTQLGAAAALVVLNLVHPEDGLLLYAPVVGLGLGLLPLLVAWLAACIGLLASLHPRMAQQAELILIWFLLFFLFGVTGAGLALAGLHLSPCVASAGMSLFAMGEMKSFLIVATVLLLLDVGFTLIALARFRRTSLLQG